MISDENSYIIEDLKNTVRAIFDHINTYFQCQREGDARGCKMLTQSLGEAYEYLVINFNVRTMAEAEELLSNLENNNNGNFQARLNSGAQLEGNPTDHLESILAFSRP